MNPGVAPVIEGKDVVTRAAHTYIYWDIRAICGEHCPEIGTEQPGKVLYKHSLRNPD